MFSKIIGHLEFSGQNRAGLGLKIFVGLLLLAHVGWICVHLNLVAKEQINPWKLGGYGMYTLPHHKALTHVFIIHEKSKKWFELARHRRLFNSFQFDTKNFLHVFRCRVSSEESIVAFMDQNPHLRYRPLVIALSETQFIRKPISSNREIYSKVEIAWNGKTLFGYRGKICGKSFDGRVIYHAPT